MQPVKTQKGVSTKSQLFDSLKVYLNNKNRLQPIIGLGSIIECVKAGTHKREALYVCEVCVCRLSKSDMRNHIMGSLHRYNYIKAWHPHLVSEWKEKSDLSKMAWPLMEMAKIIEEKEGPGDVQWLEVEDAVYQTMATHSENDAVTLITILRDGQGQGEPESHLETTSVQQVEHYPIQSQRIVLADQNQQRRSKKSQETSAETNKTIAVTKSEDWSKNTSPEPSVLENRNSFLDGYTGTKPIIGLFRMVECRSEDGRTYCFLCHCCRIRSNKKDIIDHLTRSSHLVNYLMETYPEQVEVMMADINENYQLLQSLAKKVEQEEGRGEPTVVNVPESLCILLTGKSYHWCIKMLCNGGTHTDVQKQKIAVKGPDENNTSNQRMPEKCDVGLSQWAKRMTAKRKMSGAINTVFKVSLPLTKGSMLLERTSFSMDSLPVPSVRSPPSDSELIPSPESQSGDCVLDCDAGSFAMNHAEHTSQLQHDLYGKDADAGQYTGRERNVTVTQYREADGYFNDNDDECLNQSEDVTKYQKVYGDDNSNRQRGPQERSRKRFDKEWRNEGPQTQKEWLWPAVSHTQDWPSYDSSYGREAGRTDQWYNPSPQNKVVTREESWNEMSSDATQRYNQQQQQPQNQYAAGDRTSLQTGSVGQFSNERAAHSDAARINMHPPLGHPFAHSGSIAPEPGVQFLDIEQRQLQTYMERTIGHVQTAQQWTTQSTAHKAIQIGNGVMHNPNYNVGPMTNSDQYFPHPVSGGGGWGMSQSNAFIPPGQALYYGAHANLNVSAAGFSDLMISGRSDGTTPFMFASPDFNSALRPHFYESDGCSHLMISHSDGHFVCSKNP